MEPITPPTIFDVSLVAALVATSGPLYHPTLHLPVTGTGAANHEEFKSQPR